MLPSLPSISFVRTCFAVGTAAAVAYIIGCRKQRHENKTKNLAPVPIDISGKRLLAGRTVVVTGGASGIGREIALQCIENGANVLVMDVRTTPLEGGSTVAEAAHSLRTNSAMGNRATQGETTQADALQSQVGDLVVLSGDTTSADDCDRAVDEAVRRWGSVDVWVNNAAIGLGGGLLDTTEMNWDRVMDVNSKGYWLGARSAVRQFLRQEINPITGLRGRVINISSQHGMVCCPRDIAYGVSKACAVYMTRQIAVDFAKDHVACNAVAPGKIVTGCDSDVRPYSIMRTPCPRMGRPSDVASAVVFLSSDMATQFITGINLMVDGGWTAY